MMKARLKEANKYDGSSKMHDQSEDSGESDLLSHLLFDTGYTSAAEDLGFSDAQKMESELLRFFDAEDSSS